MSRAIGISNSLDVFKAQAYPLSELKEMLQYSPERLLGVAAEGRIQLCVQVPKETTTLSLPAIALIRASGPDGIDSVSFYASKCPPIEVPDICLLALSKSDCSSIEKNGLERQNSFGIGYRLTDDNQLEELAPPYSNDPDYPHDLPGRYHRRWATYFKKAGPKAIPQYLKEIELSLESLWVTRSQIRSFLSESGPYSILMAEFGGPLSKVSEAKASRVWPRAIEGLHPEGHWSYWLKHLHSVAESTWSSAKPDDLPESYPKRGRIKSLLLQGNIPGVKLRLTANQAEDAISLICPVWARRGESPEVKSSRQSHVTPELEKMVLVAGQIAEHVAIHRTYPENATVTGWLCSKDYFDLSEKQAEVAVKILRTVPGKSPGVASAKNRKKAHPRKYKSL